MNNEELIIGDNIAEQQMTEEEKIKILLAKNGTHSYAGTLPLGMLDNSYTSGIATTMWENTNMDWVFIRDRIQTYFVKLFEWEGEDVTPDFKRELERILFRYGKVAVFKTPAGEFFPAQFTWNKKDEDFYHNPKRIKLVTTNDWNGKILNEGEFVVIYNNQSRYGTLNFANERLRQIVRSLVDVDNASLLSRPKWGVNTTGDDRAIADAELAMKSNKAFVKIGNINFQEMAIQDLSKEDNAETKINTYSFQMSNLLKMLGLKVNDGNIKAERQTELEISRNDEFDNKLIEDMFDERMDKIDDLKEFGMKIELKENEIVNESLKEETPDKDSINGEVNKKLDEVDNG